MDNLTKEQRSRLMARITGDNLGPETRLHEALRRITADFRIDRNPKLPGKPDFVLSASGVAALAVFVHGCFWHGCPEHFRCPKTRAEHWQAHIDGNRRRDARVRARLRSLGYRTAVVWEHDVRTEEASAGVAAAVVRRLFGKQKASER